MSGGFPEPPHIEGSEDALRQFVADDRLIDYTLCVRRSSDPSVILRVGAPRQLLRTFSTSAAVRSVLQDSVRIVSIHSVRCIESDTEVESVTSEEFLRCLCGLSRPSFSSASSLPRISSLFVCYGILKYLGAAASSLHLCRSFLRVVDPAQFFFALLPQFREAVRIYEDQSWFWVDVDGVSRVRIPEDASKPLRFKSGFVAAVVGLATNIRDSRPEAWTPVVRPQLAAKFCVEFGRPEQKWEIKNLGSKWIDEAEEYEGIGDDRDEQTFVQKTVTAMRRGLEAMAKLDAAKTQEQAEFSGRSKIQEVREPRLSVEEEEGGEGGSVGSEIDEVIAQLGKSQAPFEIKVMDNSRAAALFRFPKELVQDLAEKGSSINLSARCTCAVFDMKLEVTQDSLVRGLLCDFDSIPYEHLFSVYYVLNNLRLQQHLSAMANHILRCPLNKAALLGVDFVAAVKWKAKKYFEQASPDGSFHVEPTLSKLGSTYAMAVAQLFLSLFPACPKLRSFLATKRKIVFDPELQYEVADFPCRISREVMLQKAKQLIMKVASASAAPKKAPSFQFNPAAAPFVPASMRTAPVSPDPDPVATPAAGATPVSISEPAPARVERTRDAPSDAPDSVSQAEPSHRRVRVDMHVPESRLPQPASEPIGRSLGPTPLMPYSESSGRVGAVLGRLREMDFEIVVGSATLKCFRVYLFLSSEKERFLHPDCKSVSIRFPDGFRPWLTQETFLGVLLGEPPTDPREFFTLYVVLDQLGLPKHKLVVCTAQRKRRVEGRSDVAMILEEMYACSNLLRNQTEAFSDPFVNACRFLVRREKSLVDEHSDEGSLSAELERRGLYVSIFVREQPAWTDFPLSSLREMWEDCRRQLFGNSELADIHFVSAPDPSSSFDSHLSRSIPAHLGVLYVDAPSLLPFLEGPRLPFLGPDRVPLWHLSEWDVTFLLRVAYGLETDLRQLPSHDRLLTSYMVLRHTQENCSQSVVCDVARDGYQETIQDTKLFEDGFERIRWMIALLRRKNAQVEISLLDHKKNRQRLQERLEISASEKTKLEEKLDGSKSRIETMLFDQGSVETRLAASERDLVASRQKVAELQQNLTDVARKSTELEASTALVTKHNISLQKRIHDLGEVDIARREADAKLLVLENQKETLQQSIADLRDELKREREVRVRVQGEIERKVSEVDLVQKGLQNSEDLRRRLEDDKLGLQTSLEERSKELTAARQARNQALDRKEAEIGELREELRTVTEAHAQLVSTEKTQALEIANLKALLGRKETDLFGEKNRFGSQIRSLQHLLGKQGEVETSLRVQLQKSDLLRTAAEERCAVLEEELRRASLEEDETRSTLERGLAEKSRLLTEKVEELESLLLVAQDRLIEGDSTPPPSGSSIPLFCDRKLLWIALLSLLVTWILAKFFLM